jgi:pyruvate/2-oxoglutarate dehydrogenase complex dihydrolipoamide acyltransferase (E2) component
MATKVIMPSMGEGVNEGTIARWLKKEGDRVEKYEPILEIETDKVTTEATAEVAGVLLKIHIPEGTTVEAGTVLAEIGAPGEQVSDGQPATTAAPEKAAVAQERMKMALPPAKVASSNGPAQTAQAQVYTGRISPVVGRIAAEHNVDLNQIKGTGLEGRITKKDVMTYLETQGAAPAQPAFPSPSEGEGLGERVRADGPIPAAAAPAVRETRPAQPAAPAAAAPAAGELVPFTSMRRAIAEHMVRSKHTSPHVTTVFEVDFAAVAAHRAAHKEQFARDGANLTFTPYIIAAIVQALKAFPLVNSTWTDEGILLRREINIGMATAIDDGLIVPVIKNADSLNLLGLARAVNDQAERARQKQLRPEDVQGGTFTLTNHGVSGSLFATPIINQPQCGILGVGKIEKRVIVINDAIAIRPLAYVSLTFDHRILDGASADHFVSAIKTTIEGWH